MIVPDKFQPYFCINEDAFQFDFENKGHVSFKEHLHKPLDNNLWETLLYKLKPKRLEVFCIEGVYRINPKPESCTILIDKNGIVQDILYQPWYV